MFAGLRVFIACAKALCSLMHLPYSRHFAHIGLQGFMRTSSQHPALDKSVVDAL